MKHNLTHIVVCLILMFSLTGCIMAARKGLGTIVGARGSMTILTNDGSITADDSFMLVRIQNSTDKSFEQVNLNELKEAIETSLAESGYLNGTQDGDLTMVVEITKYIDRPAKKELKMSVQISRSGKSIATAELESNLQGFGSYESLTEAIGQSCIRFIKEVSQS
ncbi:MAG: hypothetical protein P8J89_01135 [Phycisphaerales bacterium]|nr:hypothetical protein [Phycisphaerales bacterium]|tara:strand:+ start:1477 stop:1971 length:495 start_codon:yes stop_codon:yes gene_type:complete